MTEIITVEEPVINVAVTEQQTSVIVTTETIETVVIEQLSKLVTVDRPVINVQVNTNEKIVVVKEDVIVVVETGIQGLPGDSAKPAEIKTQVLAHEQVNLSQLAISIYRSAIWHVFLKNTVTGATRKSIISAHFNGSDVDFCEYAIKGSRHGFYAVANLISGKITLLITNETANVITANAVLFSDLTI